MKSYLHLPGFHKGRSIPGRLFRAALEGTQVTLVTGAVDRLVVARDSIEGDLDDLARRQHGAVLVGVGQQVEHDLHLIRRVLGVVHQGEQDVGGVDLVTLAAVGLVARGHQNLPGGIAAVQPHHHGWVRAIAPPSLETLDRLVEADLQRVHDALDHDALVAEHTQQQMVRLDLVVAELLGVGASAVEDLECDRAVRYVRRFFAHGINP